MKRVLHILGSLERAGIQSFLMNIYRNINRNEIQFDFAIYNEPTDNSFAEEIRELGGKIFIIPKKNANILKCYKRIKQIVRDNNYQIVWRHTDSCIGGSDLISAYLAGAKVRVLHSHSSNVMGTAKYLHYILRPFCNRVSTNRIACSNIAGKWMFGRKDFEFIPNGVDVNKFRYNANVRNHYRSDLNLSGKTVLGSVGRFEKEKNFEFLIDIFYAYLKQNKNAVLMLIGSGSLECIYKRKIEEYDISDKVFLLGVRNDVPQLLQAFDVFMMTSIYEGFPVSLIEAQCSGLSCVVSDSISKETNLTGNVFFVPLDEGTGKWCNAISEQINSRNQNADKILYNKGYDVSTIVNRIESIIRGAYV